MPAQFTRTFAWRLNTISPLEVKEAATGDVLKPNCAYVAPGGFHLELKKVGREVRCQVVEGDNVSGHKPSVDVMMSCAAQIYGNRCLGVVMTGMGRDGSDGCKAIRAAGGYVLGQDGESSDVYGMNKVAFTEGNVDRQFHLDQGAATIMMQVQKMWGRAPVGV
jgi:two-component system chemotaxis response regulator CheB